MGLHILVFGFYGKGNVGDELMKLALARLLSSHGMNPTFVDRIDERALAGVAGVIIGGGSLLTDDPRFTPPVVEALASGRIPVFYVGCGGETDISPVHQRLIDVSEVVAFRELDTPDLAYSLDVSAYAGVKADGDLLVIPNAEVLPTHLDPHWMHASWEHFKNEFAQVLDRYVDKGLKLSFFSMCKNPRKDDAWCAHELMGRMSKRNNYDIISCGDNALDAVGIVKRFRVVITQRYHGIVASEMAGVPYVSISHHNKLKLAKPHRGPDVSYFGVQKDPVTDLIETALAMKIDPHSPPASVYDDVIDRIAKVVKERG